MSILPQPPSAGTVVRPESRGSPAVVVIADADSALAMACLRNEPGALERLVERFQTDVFGTAIRLVRDRDSALEVTNSIFYKVHQNLGSYDPSRPLRPWILRIATNETLNWLRSRRRDREHLVGGEAGELALEHVPGGPDPEAAALAGERQEAVRDALARLPERYRLVVTLRFFNDLSYEEIASQTGQDANTVGVQLLRARQMLRRELQGTAADSGSARSAGTEPRSRRQ